MRRTLAVTVAVAALLAVPAPAHAQVSRNCKSVTSGQWRATGVIAVNMPCRSARNKLRRWLRRERLPRNRNGWYCTRRSAIRGRNRQCANLTTRRGNLAFVWRQRRR
jgi:hypothetical protein